MKEMLFQLETKGNKKDFSLDELLAEVNKFDKEFGLRLKHPQWDDAKEYKKLTASNTDFGIAALLCSLNGIPTGMYIEKDKKNGVTMKYPITPYYPKFAYDSIIDWDSKKLYDISSLTFKVRYLSLLLAQLIGSTYGLSKEYVKSQGYSHSNDERALIFLKEYIKDLIIYINLLCIPEKKSQNMALRINKYISYGDKKIHHEKLETLLNGHILNIRSSMKSGLFQEKFLEDDMAIWILIKIAYMLATGKTNLKVIPKFRYVEGATKEHDLSKLIVELGTLILENTKDREFMPGFVAFCDARPRVMTDYYQLCEDNYSLKVGILSLAYADFIIEEKYVSKFIQEMLKKGM